jgi:hypothetical protein
MDSVLFGQPSETKPTVGARSIEAAGVSAAGAAGIAAIVGDLPAGVAPGAVNASG